MSHNNVFLNNPHITQSYVNGQWIDATDSATIAVDNPADLSHLVDMASLTETQIHQSVDDANVAFLNWRNVSVNQRSQIIMKWHDLILENKQQLASLMTLEQGKPLSESLGEIEYGASFISWFAEQVKQLNGRTIPSHINAAQLSTQYQPVGVAVLITPWNFPSAMITRKAAAALAAGCSVVIKPAHETPMSATALAILAEQAGFPKGVFNVVIADAQMSVKTLVAHPLTRSVSFTGSTRVGKIVYKLAADNISNIALELGGNAPFIVSEHADLERSVNIAVGAKFQGSGQDCCAANRIFVHESLYPDFVTAYTEKVKQLKVSNGMEAACDLGPLIHEKAVEHTQSLVDDALAKGAKLLTGGSVHECGPRFYTPTVIADVNPDMDIYKIENFAPISGVMSYSDENTMLAMANDTEYGLTAYICSDNLSQVQRMINALDFAMIAVNGVKFTGAPIPFGGMKASGIGREGGLEGFAPFVESKYVCIHNVA